MAEHGGKAPPKKGGGEKKSGGGFWGFLGDVLGKVSVEVNVGRPGAPSRNPTDPHERMEPVHAERQEAYEETIYRKTEGATGTAPAVRVDRDRQAIARSLDTRMGAATKPKVPQAGGAPLSSDVRAKMEPRLGSDLSGVRVHTSGESAAAAEGLSAKAFTVGDDVHFGSGQFQPGTKEGDKLIAHELTHVVQGQKSGVQRKADDAAGSDGKEPEVSDPNEPAEKEADAVGDAVADGIHGEPHGGAEAAAAPGKKVEAAAKPAAKPAQISAKLVQRKIFRTWIDKAKLPGPQKAPTTDLTHPHLVELGITNLGPYRYFPMQGTFEYKLPSALTDVWNDALAATDYQPEKPAKPQAGVTPADKAARIAKAKQKIPGIDEILTVNGGATPRAFTSVQQEDTLGTAKNAHNVQRHCISGASDMKSRDDVALRAAFGMIGGAVQGAYNTTASAFGSVADANASLAPPLNAHMTAQWSTLKFKLAAGQGPGDTVLAGGVAGAVIFRSADNAQLPEAEVPKYLATKPIHQGARPLYAGDARWQTWWNGNPPERTAWEAKHGKGNVPPPLTVDASASANGISARIIAATEAGTGGWVLHASWPNS